MVVLIESTALEGGNFEVHLEYDSLLDCHYLVCWSNCCKEEYIDGPIKGEVHCKCGEYTWRHGPGARSYFAEGQKTFEGVINWLDYWVVGTSVGIEVNIRWE